MEVDFASLVERIEVLEKKNLALQREIDMAAWTAVDNMLTSRDVFAVIGLTCAEHFGVELTDLYRNRRVGKRKKSGSDNADTRARVSFCAILMMDFGYGLTELEAHVGNVRYYAYQWRDLYKKVFYSDKSLDKEELRWMSDWVDIYRKSLQKLALYGHENARQKLLQYIEEKRMIYEHE